MIYKGIELYNVSELEKTEKFNAYKMLRYPKVVENSMLERGRLMNSTNSGVEMRFNMIDDEIKLTLCFGTEGSATTALIYYGSIGAGWKECRKTIYDTPTE